MKRGYGETSSGQVHYLSEGTGDAVLLLHQALRSGNLYTKMLPLVGKRYRAIAPDLPGRGNSDPIPAPFEVADLAKSMIELMDSLDIDKFRVVGSQTGSAVSVELAATYPDRVQGVVVYGFPFIVDEEERKRLLAVAAAGIHQEPGPGITGFPFVKPEASGAHLSRIWHWAAVRLWTGKGIPPEEGISAEDAGFVTGFLVDTLRSHEDSGHETVKAVFRWPSKERLPQVKAPILIIQSSGIHERGVTQRAEMAAKLATRSRVGSLNHTDSFAPYFIAEELSDAIVSFFDNPAV